MDDTRREVDYSRIPDEFNQGVAGLSQDLEMSTYRKVEELLRFAGQFSLEYLKESQVFRDMVANVAARFANIQELTLHDQLQAIKQWLKEEQAKIAEADFEIDMANARADFYAHMRDFYEGLEGEGMALPRSQEEHQAKLIELAEKIGFLMTRFVEQAEEEYGLTQQYEAQAQNIHRYIDSDIIGSQTKPVSLQAKQTIHQVATASLTPHLQPQVLQGLPSLKPVPGKKADAIPGQQSVEATVAPRDDFTPEETQKIREQIRNHFVRVRLMSVIETMKQLMLDVKPVHHSELHKQYHRAGEIAADLYMTKERKQFTADQLGENTALYMLSGEEFVRCYEPAGLGNASRFTPLAAFTLPQPSIGSARKQDDEYQLGAPRPSVVPR